MRSLLTLIALAAAVAGCATNTVPAKAAASFNTLRAPMDVENIERHCYVQKKFTDAANCIVKEIAGISPPPASRIFYETYSGWAKGIADVVRRGTLSDADARALLTSYRLDLQREDKQQILAGQKWVIETLSQTGDDQQTLKKLPAPVQQGQKVYKADECIGPVIMGKCEGSILDKGGYHPTCHGEWLNGQCTGPMF